MASAEKIASKGHLQLSMKDNAYDSLNEALLKSEEASDGNPVPWKYAVLHITHAVELMLKQRLYDEHPLLLWAKLKPDGHTVMLEEAITRLENAGIQFDEDDRSRLRQAIKWRNAITHYNVDLQTEEIKTCFALLFEFLTRFQAEQYPDDPDLTKHLSAKAKIIAAHVMTFFRNETVLFDGKRMHRTWTALLTDAQGFPTVSLDGKSYQRIVYGQEPFWQEHQDWVPRTECGDCACNIGQLHGPGCDIEVCPRCGGQFWFCDCNFDESELWGLTWSEADVENDNSDDDDDTLVGRYGRPKAENNAQ